MKSQRPAFTMLGAVFSELGAVFRTLKTGLFFSRDGHGSSKDLFWEIEGCFGYAKAVFSISARYKRSSIKPGATPQVQPLRGQCALQAQKQCKPSATSLLGWPRRSLFSTKVAIGVTTAGLLDNKTSSCLYANGCWHNPLELTLRYFCACSATID